MTVNLLNNWAFAYKISVPLHIIVRSGGPVASMTVGYLFNGKSYSRVQILAVFMLTLGVVGAAIADAAAKGKSLGMTSAGDSSNNLTTSIVGFTILALAMVLAAFQGIYADRLYETHGRGHWKEALFYSHVLSLPCFLPVFQQLLSQFRILLSSPPLLSQIPQSDGGSLQSFSSQSPLPKPLRWFILWLFDLLGSSPIFRFAAARVPVQVAYVIVNALTQYLCIRGVHLLSAESSSLTVTIVLNIRKLVSLMLSIYLFGNNIAPGILLGALFVFFGGGLYGIEGARLSKRKGKTD